MSEDFKPRKPDFVGYLEIPLWRDVYKTEKGMVERFTAVIANKRVVFRARYNERTDAQDSTTSDLSRSEPSETQESTV